MAQRQALRCDPLGQDDAPPHRLRGEGDRASLLRGPEVRAESDRRQEGRGRRPRQRQAHARPARVRRGGLPIRARSLRPRLARVRQGRLPGRRVRPGERECAAASDSACTFHALWSNPCFEVWPLLHLRYTTAPMDAAGCQRALADCLARELGVDYRKNMDGLFELIDPMRRDAEANAARLAKHHKAIGNDRPSSMNPGTRVASIFEELGPYLGGAKK